MQDNITKLCTVTMHILLLIFWVLKKVLNVDYCSFSVSSTSLFPDSSIKNMTHKNTSAIKFPYTCSKKSTTSI